GGRGRTRGSSLARSSPPTAWPAAGPSSGCCGSLSTSWGCPCCSRPATTPRPRCTSCTRPSWPGGSSCGGAWTWPSAPTRRATTGRRAGSRSADAVVGAGARSAPGSCVEEDVDGGRVPCRAQVVPEGDDLEALGGAREVGDAGQYGRVLRPADAAAEVLGGVP